MSNVKIIKQNKIKIVGDSETSSVEIDKEVIDRGFLKKFPESTLSLFLYLITHLNPNNKVNIEPSTLSDILPYNLKTIVKGLNHLEENDIININHNKDKPLEIEVYLDTINHTLDSKEENNKPDNDIPDLPYSDIIKKDSIPIKELTKTLISFIPLDKKDEKIREKINQWIVDFEPEVLQELIRRVLKWQKNTNHTKDKAFYYMKTIIDDWYEKEIFTYDRLQYFDKLYRETKELAQVYGINWHNLKSVQMQTFQSWLTEDFALSLEVAKFAIKQAIKRKKDGEPSIQYIEDNYIKPWKKQKIRSIQEAKKFLASSKKNASSTKKSNKTAQENDNDSELPSQSDWNQFSWEMDELIKGG